VVVDVDLVDIFNEVGFLEEWKLLVSIKGLGRVFGEGLLIDNFLELVRFV